MILWTILMVVLFLASIAGVIYLISRIRRFAWIRQLVQHKKRADLVAAILVVIIPSALLWIWMGSMNVIICLLHLIVFWIIFEAVFGVIAKRRKQPWKRYYAGAVTLLFTFLYLLAGWYQAHHVWKTDYTIQTDKAVGTIRIALLADSHVGTTFHSKGFAKHLKEIEQEKPDVILIAGDFVDDDTSKEDMINCCKALGKVKTTYGVYYVFGNHDKGYYSPEYRGYDSKELVKNLEKNHVTVLQDQNVLIDDRFYIVGRKDRSEETQRNGSRQSTKALLKNLDSSKFSIVMDHQPNDYDAQEKSGADLVVSGHTHGGQLFPLMQIENLTGLGGDDRVYGTEKRKQTNFIVTSGISDWAIKFKTGCKSEFVMINVKGK